jgi:hypothetical protein
LAAERKHVPDTLCVLYRFAETDYLKGQCHEIFDLFFFIKQLSIGQAYGLEVAKIFIFEIANFGLSGVNDTAEDKNDP